MSWTVAHLERLEAAVAEATGLKPDPARRGDLLRFALAEPDRLARDDPEAYLQRIAGTAGRGALERVAAALTVGETYFYRQPEHFDAMRRFLLPERIRARGGHEALRLLSAGCASGEEAYTLAMVLAEGWPETLRGPARVLGVDLDAGRIAAAREGRYSAWALRATPDTARARFFEPEGSRFRLASPLRDRVRFLRRNLLAPGEDLWAPRAYDVILLRNVIMYLAPEAARRLVGQAAAALAPGGYLVLGHAETLRGVSQAFELRQMDGAFVYQLREPRPVTPPDAAWPGAALLPDLAAPPATWVEAIGTASARIRALSAALGAPPATADPVHGAPARLPTPAPGPVAPTAPSPTAAAPPRAPSAGAPDTAVALALIHTEQFGPALTALTEPPGLETDPERLLLVALVLTHQRRISEAEAHLGALLRVDGLQPEAHYLRALCREHAGDLVAAAKDARTAIYLDSGFALAHLQLGRLARRSGDLREAARALAQAEELLPAEDGARILLYAGGFGRAQLLALCRAERAALEVRG